MAQLSKRKRDERRFGNPERLADVIALTPIHKWAFPRAFRFAEFEHRDNAALMIATMASAMPTVTIIDATNVAEYVYRYTMDTKSFDWKSLIVRPSFDELFIEVSGVNSATVNGKEIALPSNFPKQFGFYVQQAPAENFLAHWHEMIGRTDFNTAGGTTGVVMIPVTFNGSSKTPGYLGCSLHLLLDENGTPTDMSISSIDKWHHEEGTADAYKELLSFMSLAPLYAMKFMNCKNVTVDPADPDRAINRERRKAGLKPFLRYHTINIEPMKTVLRTEGNIETEGLKRALHICRGHFATYSEERPLFGRKAGTFWIPAHVRGSAKQGVVVSDYSVNAPKPTA